MNRHRRIKKRHRDLGQKIEKIPDLLVTSQLLVEVSAAAHLAEGPEGVRQILRAIFLAGVVSISDLARQVGLPVPVVAAVRGELEKRKILERRGGIVLSERGLSFVKKGLSISCCHRFPQLVYPPLTEELQGVLCRLQELCENRPKINPALDQSHATLETVLRRALYLYQHDGLEGRDILILGDDDLTCLSLFLLSDFLGLKIRKIVVLELDLRLVDYLQTIAKQEGWPLNVVCHDLRHNLPGRLVGCFDIFLTDPPYTLEGLDLFVSRGITGLKPEIGKQGYLCFGRRSPGETMGAVGALVKMGLAPVEILPDFNRYVGAQMLAGVSQMILTVSTSELNSRVKGDYQGPLYTADLKRRRRFHGESVSI